MKYKIKYFLYNFLYFVFKTDELAKKIQKYKKLCRKGKLEVRGKNNIFDVEKINKYGINLKINGDNNEIILGDNAKIDGILAIEINGSNNKIDIGNIGINRSLSIKMAYPPFRTENSLVKIGDGQYFTITDIYLSENNSKCIIGKNGMFAAGTLICLSDGHSIVDMNGKLLSYGGNVEIGNHVWVGEGAKILKKAKIASNSIVGAYSICASMFSEENVIIAGNPARIVKEGVNWLNTPPQVYQDNIDLATNNLEDVIR